jgi:signal transduction histidine kinase
MSGGVAAPVPFGGTPSSRSDLITFQMEPQILTSVGKKSEGLLFRRAAGNYSYARQVLATIPIAASTLIHTLASLPRGFRSAFYATSAFIATGILVVMRWLKLYYRSREKSLASLIDAKTSELRSSEERLRDSHEQLKTANEAVESANRARTIFLSSMTHDLRTPLNSILGYTQLLLRDSDRKGFDDPDVADRAETQRKLQTILTSGEQMLEMINNLVDRAKTDAPIERNLSSKGIAEEEAFAIGQRISLGHAKRTPTRPRTFASSSEAVLQPLVEPVPPNEVLRQLLGSAQRGDVIVLRDEIKKIRETDQRYELFCERVNVVLAEFRMSAIEQILKTALQQSSFVEKRVI